jgi:hypothetical protein
MAGDSLERNLSWLDGTYLGFPSADGTRLVFEENLDGGGPINATYFRRLDGSAPVRLADGEPMSVSPDWKWMISREGYTYPKNGFKLVPIGAGQTRELPRGSLRDIWWAWWHPDGKRVIVWGNEAGRPPRGYIQEVPDGQPQPFLPEGVYLLSAAISPDGRFIVGRPPEGGPGVLYPIEGGDPRPIPGLETGEAAASWFEDGRSLLVRSALSRGSLVNTIPTRIVRLDIQTGRRLPWLDLEPPDRAGVVGIGSICITPDGRYYTYSYERALSELFLVEGLK